MNILIKFWKTVAWSIFMGVVFLLPAKNLSGAPSMPFLSESVHIIMFAVLAWFFIREQQKHNKNRVPDKKIYFLTLLLGLFYGISIEILQESTGLGRKAEIKDVLFDLCGILLSTGIIMMLSLIKTKPGTKD